MKTPDAAITAARDAERKLWQHYGLTVVDRFISIEAPRLRVRMLECGTPSAEPLIFVQGGLGEACGWAPLMAKLTDFRCITLDRPGGGLSDGVDFLQVDVRKLAVDVLQAVLDAAGVHQAAFVANSMGGWWTFQLAMQAPERVSRMAMLGCPAVLLDTSAPLPMRLISVPVIGRGLVELMVPASSAKARDLPGFLGHPVQVGQRWSEAEAEAFYRLGHLPNFRRSWLTLLRLFLRLWGSNPRMRITAQELRSVAFARAAAAPNIADVGPLRGGLWGELLHAGVGLWVLFAIELLNVYKPQGMTAYGRRRVPQVAFAARAATDAGARPASGSTTRTPRWVQIVAFHAVGLAVLFVIMHLAGGGLTHH